MALTVRTDQELDAALTELAALEGLSKQEVIRRSILERRERLRHRTAVQEAGGRLAGRWADVLDRLGSM